MHPSILAGTCLLAAWLSGCAGLLGDEPSCPEEQLRLQAFRDAEEFIQERLLDAPFTIRMEGTIEGEVGTAVFAFDPEEQALRVTDPEMEMRLEGAYLSYDDGVDSYYARNHEEGAFYDLFSEGIQDALFEGDVDFSNDLTVDDYKASCLTVGGVEVVQYAHEEGEQRNVLVVERTAPHRPLSGETVDPPLQDNYRVSISYESPSIRVDDRLPRLPLTVTYTLDAYPNERGGTYFSGRFTDETEWAPFAELRVRLEDDATVYFDNTLQDGTFDWLDGDYFQYDDADGNGMVSAGDTFASDLGPGLYFTFYDAWADDYATENAV